MPGLEESPAVDVNMIEIFNLLPEIRDCRILLVVANLRRSEFPEAVHDTTN